MRRSPIGIALAGVLMGATAAAEPMEKAAEPAGAELTRPAPLTRLDGSTITVDELERFVAQKMQAARVTGLAIAILQRGEVAYVHAFGERDAERHLPLQVDTVLYGASFTKAMFGALVGELAEHHVIDLDRPIIELLNKPWSQIARYGDLASDPRANRITARMLLSHTAGFANYRWLEPDGRLHIRFEPGSKYAYSGEGINLCQLVVEAVTGYSAGDLMRTQVFEPLGMTRTSMTWQAELAGNTAVGHDRRGRGLGHVQRPAPRAAGSMDTTIADVAKFLSAMVRGTLIEPSAKQAVLAPQIEIHTTAQFPTLVMTPTRDNDRVGLAYGLGWGLLTRTPYGPGYFKEGHDDGWGHYMLAFDRSGIGVVLMSNSDNGESIYRAILEKVVHDDVTPWAWEGYP